MKTILADKNKFEKAVNNSNSIKEFLLNLGLRAAGGNYKQAAYYSKIHGIELPKCRPDNQTLQARLKKTITLEDILVENSTYSNSNMIKNRCFKAGLLKEKCYNCNLGPEWNGIKLTLQLEHINGIHNDNRIENLSILCPNCHTQTPTFCRKNNKKIKTSTSRSTKIEWPELNILIDLVKSTNYSQVGLILGVSDNAVRKHIKNHLSYH